MNIPPESIKEYQEVVLEEDGRNVSLDEAREELRNLLSCFRVILRPIEDKKGV